MKRFAMFSMVLASACLLATGCGKSNSATTASGKGFELNTISDQTVKQADQNLVNVSIDRKGGFEGQVDLEVTGLPAGVTVDGGNSQKILAKDKEINLKLLATDTAAPSDKNAIMIKASATVDGEKLSRENVFNLKVKTRGS